MAVSKEVGTESVALTVEAAVRMAHDRAVGAASYIDIDMRLPIGLAVSGLIVVAAAIWRIRRGFN